MGSGCLSASPPSCWTETEEDDYYNTSKKEKLEKKKRVKKKVIDKEGVIVVIPIPSVVNNNNNNNQQSNLERSSSSSSSLPSSSSLSSSLSSSSSSTTTTTITNLAPTLISCGGVKLNWSVKLDQLWMLRATSERRIKYFQTKINQENFEFFQNQHKILSSSSSSSSSSRQIRTRALSSPLISSSLSLLRTSESTPLTSLTSLQPLKGVAVAAAAAAAVASVSAIPQRPLSPNQDHGMINEHYYTQLMQKYHNSIHFYQQQIEEIDKLLACLSNTASFSFESNEIMMKQYQKIAQDIKMQEKKQHLELTDKLFLTRLTDNMACATPKE